MANYAIAYCSSNGSTFSDTEPYIEEAGTSLNNVVKTSIFLKDLNDFEAVNEVYGTYFIENKPARSCVQVAKLPKDAVIEIEAIAVK